MKHLLFSLLLLTASRLPSRAETTYSWPDLLQNRSIPGMKLISDGRILEIDNTNTAEVRLPLAVIENPPATNEYYSIGGLVSYEAVQGEGYLEMWSVLPSNRGDEKYFTRTLGNSGVMQKIIGTSADRQFTLPFNRRGSIAPPKRLEINLVLNGPGVVRLGPLTLVDGWSNAAMGGNSNEWWNQQASGMIGGSTGAMIGIFGGLLGSLAARNKGRMFVIPALQSMTALGAGSLIAGVVAAVLHQPWHVFGILLLIGALLTIIAPVQMRRYRKSYDELELRKMTASDALAH